MATDRSGRAGPHPRVERADPRVLRRALRRAEGRGGALDPRPGPPRPGRDRGAGALRRREVRRPGTLPDRLRPRLRDGRPDRRHPRDRPRRPPVDRLQGHLAVRHRRAEGALPPGPRHRSEARGVRADRAGGRLGRLPPALPGGRAGRRLLGPERREALHRQRLARRRDHDVRPRRDRRRGPPHRPPRRKRDEGPRGGRALRHHGAAGQRPAAPPLQRRPGATPRTCSATPARGFGSRCRSSTTAASGSAPARSAVPRSCSTWRSSTSRSGASSAAPWPTSSWSRTRSAGWSATCSGSSPCAT